MDVPKRVHIRLAKLVERQEELETSQLGCGCSGYQKIVEHPIAPVTQPVQEVQKQVGSAPITEEPKIEQELSPKIDPVPSGEDDIYGEFADEPEGESIPGIVSSADLARMHFDTLQYNGRWLDFVGEPSANFYAIVWGKPKQGKSYLCFQWAKYQTKFGRVLYVSAEELVSATLQKKIKDTGINNVPVDFLPSTDQQEIEQALESSRYKTIVIDSVNKLHMEPNEFDEFRKGFLEVAFIVIMQSTKNGNFRGSQEWTHDADIIVTVEDGVAEARGRFGAGELEVFE